MVATRWYVLVPEADLASVLNVESARPESAGKVAYRPPRARGIYLRRNNRWDRSALQRKLIGLDRGADNRCSDMDGRIAADDRAKGEQYGTFRAPAGVLHFALACPAPDVRLAEVASWSFGGAI